MLTRPLTQPLTGPLVRGVGEGGVSGFSLLSLFAGGEQGGWYDPSDLSTVFQDSAATTPGVVGQPVGKLLDKSGRGLHLSQATAAARPTLRQDANGAYYIDFDGSNDFLAAASLDLTGTDKMAILCAALPSASAGGSCILVEFSAGTNANTGSFGITAPGSGSGEIVVARRASGARGTRTGEKNSLPSQLLISTTIDLSGTTAATENPIFRINGFDGVISSGESADSGTGNFGSYALYVGARAGTSLFYKGRMYGLVLRGAATTLSTVLMGEQALMSRARMLPNIRTEGDSYLYGQGAVCLYEKLAYSTLRAVRNTGAFGSDMDGIKSRMIDPANAALLPMTTVMWDGSANGYVSNAQYLGVQADALAALGHTRFVVIPPAVPYGGSTTIPEAIAAEMAARWPNNYLDWRNYIPNTAGVINQDQMLNYPTDSVHLNGTAMDTMTTAIAAFIASKGW